MKFDIHIFRYIAYKCNTDFFSQNSHEARHGFTVVLLMLFHRLIFLYFYSHNGSEWWPVLPYLSFILNFWAYIQICNTV